MCERGQGLKRWKKDVKNVKSRGASRARLCSSYNLS